MGIHEPFTITTIPVWQNTTPMAGRHVTRLFRNTRYSLLVQVCLYGV